MNSCQGCIHSCTCRRGNLAETDIIHEALNTCMTTIAINMCVTFDYREISLSKPRKPVKVLNLIRIDVGSPVVVAQVAVCEQ